jgi:hypothetical protein
MRNQQQWQQQRVELITSLANGRGPRVHRFCLPCTLSSASPGDGGSKELVCSVRASLQDYGLIARWADWLIDGTIDSCCPFLLADLMRELV